MIFLILLLTAVSLLAADTIPLDLRYKGDMIIHNGKYPARQGIGPDGTVLSANSSKSNGVEWISSSGVSNIYNDSKGWIGISNSTPQATLDVAGGIRAQKGVSCDVNFETLTADKTLTAGVDAQYQYLNPNGANRTVYLPSDATNGDMFFIKNITDSSLPYKLTIYDNKQSKTLDYLYSGKGKWYICNGTGWGSVDDYVVGETNMSSGYGAMAFTNGMAYGYQAQATNYGTAFGYQAGGNLKGVGIGYNANGNSSGAAVGYSANGSIYGAAMGRGANGSGSGAAMGYDANGYNSGAAMGYAANGYNSGAAMGYDANGANYGTAMGYNANGADYGTAIGRGANGTNSGAAVGRDAKGANYSAGIGYATGYRIVNGETNILIGNIAGYNEDVNAITNGNYNLLIGNGAGLPSDCSYYLNIGNAIFGTNVQTKTGTNIDANTKIGIATNNPHYTLEVHGDIGLGQNGNLYKGGEKLGWFYEGIIDSSANEYYLTFPITNAYYKIEAGFGVNGENPNSISIEIQYSSSSYSKQGTYRASCFEYVDSVGCAGFVQTATTVFIETEVERVNYYKIRIYESAGGTINGNYILTRIR